jgi:hypothetical protein
MPTDSLAKAFASTRGILAHIKPGAGGRTQFERRMNTQVNDPTLFSSGTRSLPRRRG